MMQTLQELFPGHPSSSLQAALLKASNNVENAVEILLASAGPPEAATGASPVRTLIACLSAALLLPLRRPRSCIHAAPSALTMQTSSLPQAAAVASSRQPPGPSSRARAAAGPTAAPRKARWSNLDAPAAAPSGPDAHAASSGRVGIRYVDPYTRRSPPPPPPDDAFPELGAASPSGAGGGSGGSTPHGAYTPPLRPASPAVAASSAAAAPPPRLGPRKSGSWPQLVGGDVAAGAAGAGAGAWRDACATPPRTAAAGAALRRPHAPGSAAAAGPQHAQPVRPSAAGRASGTGGVNSGGNISGSGGDLDEDAWQSEVVVALAARHAWAGGDLVWAVLSSQGFDISEAERTLEEMACAQSEGMACGGSEKQPDEAAEAVAGLRLGAQAHAASDDAAVTEPGAGAAGASAEAGDAYRRHRAEALRLTRRWQAALRRAAAARGAGDFASARAAAGEAAALRREAAGAHQAASERIFREHNEGRAGGVVSA